MTTRTRIPDARAANDPAMDRALAFALRYTLPFAIVGSLAVLAFGAWVLTL